MKMTLNNKVLNPFIVTAVIILVVGNGLFFAFSTDAQLATSGAPSSTMSTPLHADTSRFSFSGAPNWRKGPSNATSMALFHTNGCFTSLEYKTGVVDPATALEKIRADLVSMDYTVALNDTATKRLKSGGQELQFQLNQYSVTGLGSGGIAKGGQEFGYLQLTDGYIEVKGFCDTADQLPTSIEALQAVDYNKI